MSKQDCVSPRTAVDLERKYSFGKKFSEIIGLIDESREHVDEVESDLTDKITETSTTLKRDTEKLVMEVRESIDQVTTTTGFTFNADGLNISKSGEEMSNQLDNTGMYVRRSGEDILVANNKGVEATNLHAKTYLIIGSGNGRSRLEDYGTDRTGVFWIG